MNHHRHSDLERRLRERLTEAAEEIEAARPAALADDVFRRLRRSQQRTRFAAVAATLAAVAALVPGAVSRTSLAEPAAARNRYVVASYCATPGDLVLSYVPKQIKPNQCFVLDPDTGRYVQLDAATWSGTVIASPDGARFLVQQADPADRSVVGSFRYTIVSRTDLLRGNTAAARWVQPGPTAALAGWSPDGRSVLFARETTVEPGGSRRTEFMLLDASTGGLTGHLLQGIGYEYGRPVWDPSGNSFWYPVWLASRPGYELRNFDLTGRAIGPAAYVPSGEIAPGRFIVGKQYELDSAWVPSTTEPPAPSLSPDLRYFTCVRLTAQLCDLRTETLHTPTSQGNAARSPGQPQTFVLPMGWYDQSHLFVTKMASSGVTIGVVDLNGHAIEMIPMAVKADQEVTFQVAPASKYPPGVGMRF